MEEKPKHTCNKCNKDFTTITLLNRHLLKKKIPCNNIDKELYSMNRRKCQHCDKILCTPNNLRYHENICKKKPVNEPQPVFEEPQSPLEDFEDDQENNIIDNSDEDIENEENDDIMQNDLDKQINNLELQNKQLHEILINKSENIDKQIDELRNTVINKLDNIDKQIDEMRNTIIKISDETRNIIIKISDENKQLRIKLSEANIYISSKRRIRQTHFRKELFKKFNNKCLITETKCNSELEACHIISINKGGTYDLDNGILLKRNLHTTFDKYYWSINPATLKICVDPEEEEIGEIKNYANKKINVSLNYTVLKNLDEHYKIFVSKQTKP